MLAGQLLGHLQRRQVAALIVVLWRFLGRIIGRIIGRRSQRLQPRLRAEAIVGAAILQQLLNAALIDLQALALDVRAGRTAVHTTLVRLNAGPRQVPEDLLLGRIVRGARVIDVIDADDHRAAVRFGKEVAVQGRPQPVQVDVACEWTPLNLIRARNNQIGNFQGPFTCGTRCVSYPDTMVAPFPLRRTRVPVCATVSDTFPRHSLPEQCPNWLDGP